LRVRKVGWRGVGLRRPRSWPAALAVGAASGVLLEGFQLFVTEPLLVRFMGKHPDVSEFRELEGNVWLALLALAVVWVLAALGEELVYRGYLMNRVADLGSRTRGAWVCSVLVVSAVFGYAHRYQGMTGIVEEGFAGFLLAVLYLRAGRNLWVPIVAHGVQDSIDVLLIFSGTYPYMRLTRTLGGPLSTSLQFQLTPADIAYCRTQADRAAGRPSPTVPGKHGVDASTSQG
jgi:membrane protease YdiL (CAAX protease family)